MHPGISPVSFSERARHKISNRSHKGAELVPGYEPDHGLLGTGAHAAPITTGPVNAMYALHESLLMVGKRAWRTPGLVTGNHGTQVPAWEAMD